MVNEAVITELDIFSSVVAPDNADDEKLKEVLSNINILINSVNTNIFENEYFAIFQAIKDAKRFNVVLNSSHFNQILLSNIEKLINSPNVKVEDFATDANDIELVKEEFISLCCTKYDELQDMELNSSRFKYNLHLYLSAWAEVQFQELYSMSYRITTDGVQIGKKFLHGITDSHHYYSKRSSEILKLVNFEERTMNEITVSPEGYTGYLEERDSEAGLEKVSHTGMVAVDETVGDLCRGDVIVTLGPPGGGKTRLNVNMAYNSVVLGHNGVYYALEGRTRRTVSLFIAKHLAEKFHRLDIDGDMIFRKTYRDEDREIVEGAEYDLFNNPNYGKFKVIPSPLYDEEIESNLEAIWDNNDGTGFEFDWVCIDHTSLIQSRQFTSVTETLTNILPKLETMAQSFKNKGFMLLLPHQLKTETIKSLMKGSNETIVGAADSSSVIKSAHTAFTIFTDEDLKLKDMAKLICTKSRNSSGFPARNVYALLGTCTFQDLDVEDEE